MAPNTKKEAPAKKQQRLFFGSEHSAERCLEPEHKEDPHVTHFQQPKTPRLQKPNMLARATPGETSLTTESAMKKTEDNSTLVLLKDVMANKQPIKQVMKKVRDLEAAKGNTLIIPMQRRRCRLCRLLIMMLWVSPTKRGSLNLIPTG